MQVIMSEEYGWRNTQEGSRWRGGAAIFNGVVKEGLSEKAPPEPRPAHLHGPNLRGGASAHDCFGSFGRIKVGEQASGLMVFTQWLTVVGPKPGPPISPVQFAKIHSTEGEILLTLPSHTRPPAFGSLLLISAGQAEA